jgi:hypothetical protein
VEVPEVAFDEAGHTGENLLDSNQPVYVLASVALELDDAAALTSADGSAELHFAAAVRSDAGRRRVLDVLGSSLLTPDTVRLAWVDKSFMITAKVVSLILEPYLAARGVFIENDTRAYELATILHKTLPVADSEAFVVLQRSFVEVVRGDRSASARLRRAIKALQDAAGTSQLAEVLATLGIAAAEFTLPDAELPAPTTDPGHNACDGDPFTPELHPGFPCLTSLLHAWADRLGPFGVIHDEHVEAAEWGPWLARIHAEARPGIVRAPFGSLAYPVPVTSFAFARSHDDPRIQVADVVAGAAASLATAAIGARVRDPRLVEVLRADVPQLDEWIELSISL